MHANMYIDTCMSIRTITYQLISFVHIRLLLLDINNQYGRYAHNLFEKLYLMIENEWNKPNNSTSN